MLKEKVRTLLEKGLEEDPSLFLIDFTISSDNKIKVIIDGDRGVTVNDCIKISRAIEHNLDREEGDFALEVASAGATAPMVMPRQYIKNIGRKLEVETSNSSYEGKLTQANEDFIILEWKAREPKPIGKGKVTVQKREEIPFSDIKKAKVILKF
ncbi:ribosome assembly cofactor RimP [Maribacter cobaltidurans]|uniref:Ribosome maturation factor RimP n=1 Tax=Maribacter cobaltidurans TaxID=1178778 RepID=A0A223V249_9FLAO|nr:ribosome assembly cofactor RimP [Maribacter cobaltidurans]ASV29503.1 ribosome assembly cofactor RimP [Maribacter cobaltidurans]GGD68454.1 ribosome maturation factor RimP [Maribacter cobaltidurans]